jgi:hypothetical protein
MGILAIAMWRAAVSVAVDSTTMAQWTAVLDR